MCDGKFARILRVRLAFFAEHRRAGTSGFSKYSKIFCLALSLPLVETGIAQGDRSAHKM